MKASVTFNADATMTLQVETQTQPIHFDRLSRLVDYCRDNEIEITSTTTNDD